ncbi:MAG TPA: hypothetical protein VEB42_06205 [Chitinophagaceae bacterium]|nr:hypothetical protein [Chitinophagaceae bacterium]
MPYTLAEALALLESGQLVSLRYITANTSKGAGGKVVELARVKIARNTEAKKAAASKEPPAGKTEGKDPRHRFHFTRNIELQNRAIRTVYPILITHINGQTVL